MSRAGTKVTYVPSEVKVEEVGDSKQVFVSASVGIRTEVSFVLGEKEYLDEAEALDAILKIRRLERFSLNASASASKGTLVNAVHECEGAMNSFNRLLMFKHFYASLELTANADGTDRVGDDLREDARSYPSRWCV